jgi:methylamine dehydrogenase accessory protein MauD
MSTPWIIAAVLQWAIIVGLCVLTLSLVRQLGVISVRLNPSAGIDLGGEGPGPGTELSAEPVALLTGEDYQFAGAREKPLMTVYLSPDCTICNRVSSAMRAVSRDYRDEVDFLLVVSATPKVARRYVEEKDLGHLPVALRQDMPKHLAINTTPFALAMTHEGTVAMRAIPNDTEHLEEVIRAALEYQPPTPAEDVALDIQAVSNGTANP